MTDVARGAPARQSDTGSPGPTGTAAGSDLELLRAYEPIARFTRGELFFPTAVEPYAAHCSLWATDPEGLAACLVPAGRLTLGRLCEEALSRPDAQLSLRFVQRPLSRADLARWRRESRDRLAATVRFTTTGMFGRLVDAGFRASLLWRGTVAAGLAAAAEITYRERLEPERLTYYGRVVRDGGYVCLQYWFFYAMNDWRSTFSGVNDHEADWEMATVYLAEPAEGSPRPLWVAFSSHDYDGDDLRRRWDDPELLREGDHPVLFPGAGSHSGAFVPGDYVVTVDPPRLRRAIALTHRVQRFLAPWRDHTRHGSGFGIPFVDYARGDGKAVGPGQASQWQPVLIDDHTPWVRDYRGLWGLDTEDPFGGERAPSGPRYERDGSLRPAWANPLGWAGLLKVPPADEQVVALLAERTEALEVQLQELDQTIADHRDQLRGAEVELRSLEPHGHAWSRTERKRAEMAERERALNQTIAERARLSEELRAHVDTLGGPLPTVEPQAHIKRRHGPRTDAQERRTRVLRVWAALSTPMLLALVPVVLLARPLAWATTVAAAALLFIGMEAFARRRFLSFVASTILLAATVFAVLVFVRLGHQYWRYALGAVFGVAALALLIGNLGDLRHGWRRGGAMGDGPDGS
ncbi:MAG: hypothetical protein JO168_01415 [Solirubrobacterales bacterium]|nr:hypothetical protein [Solirubrobacterales bacterium]MBV9715867.1 hypothetical protein [Solirubrobacterales bacterium]